MTTANELYKKKPKYTTFDIYGMLRHVPEIGERHSVSEANQELYQRVEWAILEYHSFDDRRYWRLGTVWFDGWPVMITQNAGREGDDHSERFITDRELYGAMLTYLHSLESFDSEYGDFLDPSEDRDDLTAFYGASWDGE